MLREAHLSAEISGRLGEGKSEEKAEVHTADRGRFLFFRVRKCCVLLVSYDTTGTF